MQLKPIVAKSEVKQHLLWLMGGLALAFAIPAFFAGVLELPRDIYLIPYVIGMSAFLYTYIRLNDVKVLALLRHKLAWGLLAAIPLSFYAIQSVMIQPSSPAPQGVELALEMSWSGIVYGGLDVIALSTFPVYAMWQVMKVKGWTNNGLKKKTVAGAVALAASLLMIAVYHLGYPELRGPQVIMVVLGVGVMSLASIITGNPTVAMISHIAMHVAAVLHGAETVTQLPPHYG